MVTVKDAKLGFGTVRFFGKIDPVPETVSRQGNVTIKNAAQPGQPAYFDVSYQLQFLADRDGISEFNVFTVSLPLTGISHDTPYSRVEGEAARQLAPMLRSFADEIEKLVAESEKQPDTTDQP